jgi:hypothetical protein
VGLNEVEKDAEEVDMYYPLLEITGKSSSGFLDDFGKSRYSHVAEQ